MKSENRNNKKIIIVALLLIISIGFSIISSSLTISGVSSIKGNTWDVHFENVEVKSGSVTAPIPTISASETTVTYNVTLDQPGDFYEFTVDAVNDGTIDAMVDTVSNTGLTENQQKYLIYQATYEDDSEIMTKHSLKKQTTETYKVRVEYNSEVEGEDLPGADQTVTLTFSVNYVQADGTAVSRALIRAISGDGTHVGDQVAIDSEEFYVLGNDNTNLTLFAKNNLYVGSSCDPEGTVTPLPTSGAGYNLQDATAKGWVNESVTYVGTVKFSGTNYWYDSGLKPKYGSSYSVSNIYDTEYSTAPNDIANPTNTNYSVAHYIQAYKSKLEALGVTINSARLMTYQESEAFKNAGFNNELVSSSYWLATASTSTQVWSIVSGSGLNKTVYTSNNSRGVRPVVIIPASSI